MKDVESPTIISTFAGCGGSSLGYKLAGFRELLAVEWDNNAVATFRLNFPDVPVYHGDIKKLSVEECLRLADIKPGELDVLDGSPPCQGFSTAGKRKMTDPRNTLFQDFARLLAGLQPKVFVIENVTGMVKGYMKQVYLECVKTLRGCGYRVKGQVLNAMYYNVPQSRKRVIIIGVRKDLEAEPSHPKPVGRPMTVGEAIGHLPQGKQGKHELQVIVAWHKSIPNQLLRKACRFVGSFQSVRLDSNRPSPTQIKMHSNWRWDIPRKLTVQEAACIQSFPESYRFAGNKGEAQMRIGNSVPPNMMRAIAEHIRGTILK